MPIKYHLLPFLYSNPLDICKYLKHTVDVYIFKHKDSHKREKTAQESRCSRIREAFTQPRKSHVAKRMKIQCDVCGQEEASVFCTADEAALCEACDNRVHNANKLASKHPRFSLRRPQVKESPLCDICQIKKALLFCQEDRALLCRECDIPIHKANESTKKHNRFLLSGVNISAAGSSFQATTSSTGSQSETEIKSFTSETTLHANSATGSESSSNPWGSNIGNSQVSTSTASDYLMETLPGWQVDDLMDPSSHYDFYKIYNEMSQFANQEGGDTFCPLSNKDVSMWLPHEPSQTTHPPEISDRNKGTKCKKKSR